MNQSAIIGGALLAGFALFLASRDRLSTYGRVMWGAKPASHTPPAAEPTSPTQGALPGLPDFDPLDPFGSWGYGPGDLLKDLGSIGIGQ